MYDNIGGKIKGLAKATFIVEAIAAAITGFTFMASNGFLLGLLVIVAGVLVAWVSSWFLYGYGELIEKTCEIARNTYGGEIKSEEQTKEDLKRISRIEKLRSEGLITEEEYRQAISKEE